MEPINPLELCEFLQDPLRSGDKCKSMVSLYHILSFFRSWISRYFLSSTLSSLCLLFLSKREQYTSNLNGKYSTIFQMAKLPPANNPGDSWSLLRTTSVQGIGQTTQSWSVDLVVTSAGRIIEEVKSGGSLGYSNHTLVEFVFSRNMGPGLLDHIHTCFYIAFSNFSKGCND